MCYSTDATASDINAYSTVEAINCLNIQLHQSSPLSEVSELSSGSRAGSPAATLAAMCCRMRTQCLCATVPSAKFFKSSAGKKRSCGPTTLRLQ